MGGCGGRLWDLWPKDLACVIGSPARQKGGSLVNGLSSAAVRLWVDTAGYGACKLQRDDLRGHEVSEVPSCSQMEIDGVHCTCVCVCVCVCGDRRNRTRQSKQRKAGQNRGPDTWCISIRVHLIRFDRDTCLPLHRTTPGWIRGGDGGCGMNHGHLQIFPHITE